MRLQYILACCLLLVGFACEKKVLTENPVPKPIPLHDLKSSPEIEQEKYASNKAYYYAYIGEDKKALETYEVDLAWGFDTITPEHKAEFLTYQPINAIEYLAERTKEEQILIISEAHQKPAHRVFTRQLLRVLYENGYRYLGMEALMPSYGDSTKFLLDTLLHERAYPLNSPITGTYTREPQMGNLVREAIKIGFQLFAYEIAESEEERDLVQARKIERFMKQHPDGKLVLHCGWYHAIESNLPKREKDNWMAYHLKQRTGINPFTIYQDVLTEKIAIDESPYYELVDSDEVSVLVNEAGDTYGGEHFDALLYHPRTNYIKNRPHWLWEVEGNQAVKVQQKYLKDLVFPVIVRAYGKNENRNATPIDMIELDSVEEETVLLLPKGKYHIVLRGTDKNEVQYQQKVR